MIMKCIFMMKLHEMVHTKREMHEMQFIDFGYMQRDVTLIFDHDHNLIILFLILLRI